MRVFPRLADVDGLERLAQMRETPTAQMTKLVAFEHPRAVPVPTGGRPITIDELEQLREDVMEGLAGFMVVPIVPRGQVSSFDMLLGQLLHSGMDVVAADAAHDEVWTFLSAVVFPDIVVARFPDLHEDRVLGRRRNTLRRAWEREDVLGDLQRNAAQQLREDELVGLFERTSLARNRALIRALAKRVLSEHEEKRSRSQFARDLYREAAYATGPVLLDVLSESELDTLVAGLAV